MSGTEGEKRNYIKHAEFQTGFFDWGGKDV